MVTGVTRFDTNSPYDTPTDYLSRPLLPSEIPVDEVLRVTWDGAGQVSSWSREEVGRC